MVFSSTIFLFFFLPAVLVLYFLPIRIRGWKNGVLLATSLFFYAWGEPTFVFVMLFSILVNWVCSLKIAATQQKKSRKRWLAAAVVFDLLLLFVFKYLGFVLRNVGLLLQREGLGVEIALPIGISFFTFQIMSYVFDVYYGNAAVQKSYPRLALYISMFPQLIAGPIVRYETIAEQIGDRSETRTLFSEGMARFIVGLGKKALLANYAGLIADNIFAVSTAHLAVGTAWIGAIAYTLQIYFDFSGYSDMAIGLGSMFGFRFEENFNYPYLACSITDFWRRWHISLSTWFRDYVYIPLGGSRKGDRRTVLNLFTVWLLTGIWHGANWTFIVWGLYFFVLLFIEKQTRIDKKLGGFYRIVTLLLVIVSWVLFRSASVADAVRYLGVMFGVSAYAATDALSAYFLENGLVILLIGVVCSFPILGAIKRYVRIPQALRTIGLLTVFALSLLACVKSTYNPFIYFNF